MTPLTGKQLREAIVNSTPVRYVYEPHGRCASRMDEIVLVTNPFEDVYYIGEITDIDPNDFADNEAVVWECTNSDGGEEGIYLVEED